MIQRALTATSFGVIHGARGLYESLRLPALSTGRSFTQYRKAFFEGRPAGEVLDALRGRRVVDVGCGLTPYVRNSMFQACYAAGVEYYGVDPKLAEGFRLGFLDRAKVHLVGGRGMDPDAAGLERALGTRADALPFGDGSIGLALSYYVLYTWLVDEAVLAATFEELYRVLEPGGELRIFPAPYHDPSRILDARLREAIGRFEVEQHFRFTPTEPLQIPPAYLRVLRRR